MKRFLCIGLLLLFCLTGCTFNPWPSELKSINIDDSAWEFLVSNYDKQRYIYRGVEFDLVAPEYIAQDTYADLMFVNDTVVVLTSRKGMIYYDIKDKITLREVSTQEIGEEAHSICKNHL